MTKTLFRRGRGLDGRTAAYFVACLLASIVAGCGAGSSDTTTAVQGVAATTTPIRAHDTHGATQRFLFQVNVVCRAVRQGAPVAINAPYTPAALRRYVNQAQPAAQRTVVSLQRLASHGDQRVLEQLVAGYKQLQSVYKAVRVVGRQAHAGQQLGSTIKLHEQTVTAAAREAGLPACGVAGR